MGDGGKLTVSRPVIPGKNKQLIIFFDKLDRHLNIFTERLHLDIYFRLNLTNGHVQLGI